MRSRLPTLQTGDNAVAESAALDAHPMFLNAPLEPPTKAPSSARSARFYCTPDEEFGFWGDNSIDEWKPTYRTARRPRGLADQSQFNTMNVPELTNADIKRYRPGEISHERVWSIARSLEEKLPALTAG